MALNYLKSMALGLVLVLSASHSFAENSIDLTGLFNTDAVEEEMARIDDKAIRIRPASSLDFTVSALRASYRTGEPIRFKVKGTDYFYLYVFNVNKKLGKATVLLPNRYQKSNRYQANKSFLVPNKSVEFYADRPGKERIIMVASSKPLNLKKYNYKTKGDFWINSANQVEQHVKAIRIRSAKQKKRGLVVKDMTIRIH